MLLVQYKLRTNIEERKNNLLMGNLYEEKRGLFLDGGVGLCGNDSFLADSGQDGAL
jgi:hypothetical protein